MSRISLHPAEKKDLSHVFRWWNDPDNYAATGIEEGFSLKDLEDRFSRRGNSSPREEWVIARIRGPKTPVGMLILNPEYPEPTTLSIKSFLVDKKYRRRGLGKKIVKELEKWILSEHPDCSNLFLRVLEDFKGARLFWESCGFKRAGIVDTGYRHKGKKQRAYCYRKTPES